nr:hypothetical protein [Mucilaginibacter sp. L294]
MSITFYNIALVTHVVGITIMAGTTFIDLITFRVVANNYKTNKAKSIVFEDYLYQLQKFIGIGMLVILLSGVIMMVKLHEVWGAQIWFRIKMGVLLLVIANGLALRRIAGTKLKQVLAIPQPGNHADREFKTIKQNLTAIQVIQLLLFLTAYVLSIFKFN